MKIETEIPLLESILGQWEDLIGDGFEGYKNHCYRMLNFCFFLHDCSEAEKKKLIISASFHDLGLWTENTLDYLPPSVLLAENYLKEHKLDSWIEEVSLVIDLHHKITSYKGSEFPLVEVFRRADLTDFSLGIIKGGVSKEYVREVKKVFPNAGFHKGLVKAQMKWLSKHPLNPAPIFKW